MNYGELVAAVRARGHYGSQREASNVTMAVLEILASRLPPRQAAGLAAQLPGPLAGKLRGWHPPASFGVEEFLLRVAEGASDGLRSAEWDARAVLSTLATALPQRQLGQLLSVLPAAYAPLFGTPAPATPPAPGRRK